MELALAEDLGRVATTDVREVRNVLTGVISQTAKAAVLRMLRQYAADSILAAMEGNAPDPVFEIRPALAEAKSRRFAACGGQQRLLMVLPEPLAEKVSAETLGALTNTAPTLVTDADADMLLCYEVEDLPLSRIASTVLDQQLQAMETASRLHTRTDVPWTPL